MSDRVAVFRRGRIEQVAVPETLYEEPERPFVASFIGENNMLRGRVLNVEKDIARVHVGGQIVQAFQVAPCKPGDPVILSIRPERVCLAPATEVYDNRFEAVIEDIVFLGDHLRLHVTVCGRAGFVVKIPNIVGHGAVLEGDRIQVGWTATDCRALLPDEEEVAS